MDYCCCIVWQRCRSIRKRLANTLLSNARAEASFSSPGRCVPPRHCFSVQWFPCLCFFLPRHRLPGFRFLARRASLKALHFRLRASDFSGTRCRTS